MNDAGIDASLGQASGVICVLPGHGSPVALNVASMRSRSRALKALKRMLAALHMAHRTLLHVLRVVAGIIDILMAEPAFHEKPPDLVGRPT